ncbi:MAG: TIM barrel protein [Methylobacteriaceae bacterium]|nr:TIM barrel protein [Methylobacteriaceae bacterium]
MPSDPRFSANISMLFPEYPFLDRIDAAARAGFAAVECQFPYDFRVRDIRERLDANGIVMTGLNTTRGDVAAGERGMAAVPGRGATFREHLAQALDYAAALDVRKIHCMSGTVDRNAPGAAETFLTNLAYASDECRTAGVTLLIEPLNTRDNPGYFVSTSDDVIGLLQTLDRDNVTLLFDVYHVQIMEGDLLTRLERHWPRIGHFQVASVPGRHEPDEGEVAYPAVLQAIAERGWKSWIGCEYNPRGGTEEGLGWMRAYRSA